MAAVADPADDERFSVADAWAGARLSLSMSWRYARVDTVALVAAPLIVSLVPAALAIALRGLINAVSAEMDGADPGRYRWEFYVLVSLVLALVIAVTQSINAYFLERHIETLDQEVGIGVLEHAETLEFGYFEDPTFQDTIRQARESPGAHVQDVMVKAVRSLASLMTISSLLLVLARIEIRLIVYIIPLTIPFLLQRWWIGRLRYETQIAQNRSRRWVEYFSGQLMTADSVPEARVLGVGPLFIQRAGTRLGAIRRANEAVYRKQGLSSGIFNALAVGLVYLALYQATKRTIDGELTVGDIAVFAAAATAVRTAIEALFSSLSSLRWHLAHLGHLRRFLALQPVRELPDPPSADRSPSPRPPPAPNGARTALGEGGPGRPSGGVAAPPEGDVLVRVDDVSFTYPSATHPTLDGFSIDIRAGETLGLVGRNGSGKTTLVKLLSGLYVPQSGTVTVNGRRTDEATADDLRAQMSIVFQSFGRYNATVAENIAMGDLDRLLGDRERIRAVAEWAGLREMIESLPDGYDTLLGREFGDVSLSGGQWQRLAIARAFAHDAPLMILDEPTASLDAEAEFEVFQRFAELAADRAALLISHRFSTLSLADRIAVVDRGRVSEVGTHDELLEVGGTYAELHRLFRTSGESGVWGGE